MASPFNAAQLSSMLGWGIHDREQLPVSKFSGYGTRRIHCSSMVPHSIARFH